MVFINTNRTAAASIRNEAIASLKLDITRLQNILYNLLTESANNLEMARLNLLVTAMDQDIKTLILTNNDNKVLMANHHLWQSQDASDVTLYQSSIAATVKKSNTSQIFFDKNNDTLLIGYYPVVLKLENTQGLPIKRLGILYSELSIETKLKQAKVSAANQSLIFGGLMLFAALVIAYLLHIQVSRRLARLTETARRLSTGNLNLYAEESGSDELSLLGTAFNDMLSRLKLDIQRRIHAEKDLRELNETLEHRVETRSRELDEKKQQLLASQALAHQANKLAALGEMASGIAHEINSPLQSITLMTFRMKRASEKNDNDACLDSIQRIENAVSTITNIIDGLRKMSRDSSNDIFEDTTPAEIINNVTSITTERYRLKGIVFTIGYHNLGNILINCQQLRIGQILINLLNNSYDAVLCMADKWIKLELHDAGDFIQFWVIDSGNGIDTSDLQRVFEPMYTTKDIGLGTGLGLSISAEIARQHGGTLTIDSSAKNTTFILNLPKSH